MPTPRRASPEYLLPRSHRNAALGFVDGTRLPFHAAGFLLARPRLWLLVAIPLVLNLLIFVGLIGWGFSEFADGLRAWLDGHTAWYWHVLLWLSRILFWLIVLVVVYFIFTPVALLIASPFNDRLAEHVERAAGFAIEDDRPLLTMIASEVLFAIFCEAKRLAIAIGVFLALLPLNLLPGIGSVAYAAICFAWASWSVAAQFTGYAADRRHLGIREGWRLLRSNPSLTAGFGVVTAGLMMVPFLNVFIVPVGAVGGTFLFGLLAGAGPRS